MPYIGNLVEEFEWFFTEKAMLDDPAATDATKLLKQAQGLGSGALCDWALAPCLGVALITSHAIWLAAMLVHPQAWTANPGMPGPWVVIALFGAIPWTLLCEHIAHRKLVRHWTQDAEVRPWTYRLMANSMRRRMFWYYVAQREWQKASLCGPGELFAKRQNLPSIMRVIDTLCPEGAAPLLFAMFGNDISRIPKDEGLLPEWRVEQHYLENFATPAQIVPIEF